MSLHANLVKVSLLALLTIRMLCALLIVSLLFQNIQSKHFQFPVCSRSSPPFATPPCLHRPIRISYPADVLIVPVLQNCLNYIDKNISSDNIIWCKCHSLTPRRTSASRAN